MIKDIKEILYIIIKSVKKYFYEKKNPSLSFQEYKRKNTYIKFEAPERKAIYESVILTDEQIGEIDALYEKNYGTKIPYIWHKHFTAFTGNFDSRYFPETLYIPEFEYYMNLDNAYVKVLEDKNFIPMVAKGVGIKTPETVLSCTKGFFCDKDGACDKKTALLKMADAGEVFIKPTVDTSSGEKCFLADIRSGKDIISSRTLENIFDELGNDFVIQKKIICSNDIRNLYPKSVNTFRVITYRWRNEIIAMPVMMRIGQGDAVVDNAHAGGMFIAINNDGTLHKTAFSEFKKEYEVHPDSNVRFEGYQINGFKSVIDSAKLMHTNLPQVGSINWDFTIDDTDTPILVEANVCGGGIWAIEMAHGCGPFGDKTEEVLQWLKLMNSLPSEKYCEHMFGNF